MNDINDLLKNHKTINKELVQIKDVIGDGNCYYRTLSLYFTNEESYYKFFREQIYLAAMNNINELKEFFLNNENDEILNNN